MALTLQHLRTRALRGAFVVGMIASLASCGVIEEDITANWDAQRLYTEARSAVEESDWPRAQDYYMKLEARYPFGRYAQQAQIESAYAFWQDGDVAQALQACERFLKQYPNHENSDYVLYMKALATLNEPTGFISNLFKQDLAERDAEACRSAFDTFKELVERFPDSRYASEARRRMHELVLAQARYELKVAQYYFDRYAYVAAIERAQNVIREYQQTPYSDDALVLIRNAYKELGITDLEGDMHKILDVNQNRTRANIQ